MTPIIAQPSSHFYRWLDDHWEAYYETQRADGGGTRRTTLADARKVGAVPSVTAILGILNKPGLEIWKQTQLVEACLTLPRLPGELLDDYARRAVEDADARSETARTFGSDLHRAIEAELCGLQGTWANPKLEAFALPVRAWLHKNVQTVFATEKIVGDRGLGFAGRLDLGADIKDIGWAVVDFKTQSIRNGKPNYYDEWPIQLAAYRHCLMRPEADTKLVSVVIDSVTPGGIHVKVWDDDAEVYFALFEYCLTLWKYLRNYSPKPL